jgi:hypothetical protein
MTSAARRKRHRARDGLVVTVEVDYDVVKLLCEARLLDPRADFHSRTDITAAVGPFLSLARRA